MTGMTMFVMELVCAGNEGGVELGVGICFIWRVSDGGELVPLCCATTTSDRVNI